MPAITLSGIATGIDTNAIVQQLVSAAGGPMKQLVARQSTYEKQASAYDTIRSRLETLQSSVDKLNDSQSLRSYKIDSSDTTIASVESSSSASEGSHTIVVDSLAAAEREVHTGLAAKETLVGEGAFSYTYNGVTRTILTTDTTTLEGLRDLINNDAGNAGVSASILQYNSGLGTEFHLVLGGDDTGSDYGITVNDAQTTLNGANGTADFSAASFLQTQGAQDSRIRVDGYPASDWITRSSNTIDDVLPGVTVHLHKAGTVQVSLSRNTEQLKTNIGSWVSAYNAVVNYLHEQTKYDSATKKAGLLIGDTTVTAIQHQLRMPFAHGAAGFLDAIDAFSLPGEIGLSVDKDGALSLDSDKLDDALSKDYLGVLSLLGASRSGASSSQHLQFQASDEYTVPGSYDVKATFDGSGTLISAQIKLSTEAQSEWRDAVIEGNEIIGDSDGPERNLQIIAAWDGASTTQTAVIRVRQGIAGGAFDSLENLLDDQDGALALAKSNAQSSIDILEKNIEQQQKRLEVMQKTLTAQYARLEAVLSQMKGIQSAVASLTASLS